MIGTIPPVTALRPPPDRMRQQADAFEAVFLAEMLRHAGLGKPLSGFGGGIGEEQFTSLLVRAQAEAMVAAGGIGISARIYAEMQRGER